MVKGAIGLTDIQKTTEEVKVDGAKDPEVPAKQADRLEHEIEEIRSNLGRLVTELDRRRHRLDPMVVVRRHAFAFAVGGLVLAGAVVGGVVGRRKKFPDHSSLRQSLGARGRHLMAALGKAVAKPDDVANAKPDIGMKILTAVAAALAGVAVRRLATRFLDGPKNA